MTAQLILNFENDADLTAVLVLLRENGLEKLLFSPKKTVAQTRKSRRKAGFSKAKFSMASDFNAPLEDFKEYMK